MNIGAKIINRVKCCFKKHQLVEIKRFQHKIHEYEEAIFNKCKVCGKCFEKVWDNGGGITFAFGPSEGFTYADGEIIKGDVEKRITFFINHENWSEVKCHK
jgi:hypothetical protein